MEDAELLFLLRIRDPETRSLVRRHLGEFGAVAVTDNIWELPKSAADTGESRADWWDEELCWLENALDSRTDVIYVWSVQNGALVRSTLGGGG